MAEVLSGGEMNTSLLFDILKAGDSEVEECEVVGLPDTCISGRGEDAFSADDAAEIALGERSTMSSMTVLKCPRYESKPIDGAWRQAKTNPR